MLGFRSAAHAEAAGLFAGEVRLTTDDGSSGRAGLVTDLLREELGRDPAATVFACGPPPMLEAVRAMCAERGVTAQLALESGMACGFGACYGCVVPTRDGYLRLCVDGPVLDAAGSTPRSSRGRALMDLCGVELARAGAERLGHLRRHRGEAGLRRPAARALPLPRLRVQDDHARAAAGQPAPQAVGDPGGDDQLDRAPQPGSGGLPRPRPARARRAPGAAGRLRHGVQQGRAGHPGGARSAPATRWR